MDLDTVAWLAGTSTPARKPFPDSKAEILKIVALDCWVVEGCYADLLEVAVPRATEIVFLNPGADTCVQNARNRPWEPHKYSSPEEQDANLEMLVNWIREYDRRTDEFSYTAHRRLFDNFVGSKREFLSNEREASPSAT